MPEHADSLKVAVGAFLEFDTNKVAEWDSGGVRMPVQRHSWLHVEVMLEVLDEQDTERVVIEGNPLKCPQDRVQDGSTSNCGLSDATEVEVIS